MLLLIERDWKGSIPELLAIRSSLNTLLDLDLAIIEDAAHAAGSEYKGTPIGATTKLGTTAACFSFHPIKNMTSAEGGMVATDDAELADRL